MNDKHDDLYWECYEANADEVRWVELLIQDRVLPPNIFNSFLWLKDCQERLKAPSKVLPIFNNLEISDDFDLEKHPPLPPYTLSKEWSGSDTLERLSQRPPFPAYECPAEPNLTNATPLELFQSYVRRGHHPPPELLLSIAKAFDLYFQAHGKLSLEQVFFDPPLTKKQGNYSKRSIKKFKGLSYLDFHEAIDYSKSTKATNTTIEDLAMNFIRAFVPEENHTVNEEDLDSFLRGYRRWKAAHFPAEDK
jgi:hypothetical protein